MDHEATGGRDRGRSRGRNRGTRRGRGGFGSREHQERRAALVATSRETLLALPAILAQIPHLDASHSDKHDYDSSPALDPSKCPNFRLPGSADGKTVFGTRVTVVNEDTFNAAIALATSSPAADDQTAAVQMPQRNQRVAVLNLASDKSPGGGWLSGASAQEEALCYRSSLALSLHKEHYPWAPLTGFYTRDVVIIRSDMGAGHALLTPAVAAADLPVVSVVSVAGVRNPPLKDASPGVPQAGGAGGDRAKVFKFAADRELTKKKMRLTLRIAAGARHEVVVLGAIGCGAFHNPPNEVANCWLEVLGEDEFKGGWWRELCFAVLDRRNEGNFEVFDEVLGGQVTGREEEEE